MKNPIRAWVAKVAREEIHADLRERNMKAIQDEMNRMLITVELDNNRAAKDRRRKAKS